MRNFIQIIAIFGILVSCNQEDDNLIKQAEGYILGYNPCSVILDGVNGNSAQGFYFVSTNLKDTLLTYNLPKNTFDIPSCYIASTEYYVNDYFPDSARFDFKVKIEYTNATIDEQKEAHCIFTGLQLIDCVFEKEYTQIIIKSAKQLN